MQRIKPETGNRKPVSIAIDPGYDRIGIAVFEGKALVHSECFTPKKDTFPKILAEIYAHLTKLIKKYEPETFAIETLFFTKNQKTAMKVAEARGVIQLAAANEGLTMTEYSPQAVKIAVTGSGNATKDAVIRMVERLIILPKQKRHDDEYDAIALGIAHTATIRVFRQSPQVGLPLLAKCTVSVKNSPSPRHL